MPYCFTGITEVQSYHNPDEGRFIWNQNFQNVGCALESLSMSSNTGSTVVTNGDSNIVVELSGTSVPPIYAVSLSDDIVTNSLSANTIYVTNPNDAASFNLPIVSESFSSTTHGDVWISTGITGTILNVVIGGITKRVELT